MGATEPTTSFSSCSLVLFQHTFLRDLFFNNRAAVRKNFRFLLDDTCIADLLANGYTDLNLADGRFWDSADPFDDVLAAAIPDFDSPSEITPDSTKRWELRYCRDASSLRAMGTSVKQLMDVFHPGWPKLSQPFVPYLGSLMVCRNAIANAMRSSTYALVSSFLPRSLQSHFFGTDYDAQSAIHFPLAIKTRSTINFSTPASCFGEGSSRPVLRIVPTLRVHIYPYGLVTVSLILNIAASSPFTTESMIELQEQCLNAPPRELRSLISYGKVFQGTVPEFFSWVSDLIVHAVTPDRQLGEGYRSAIHTVTCLSRPFPLMAVRERVGLLAREVDWANLTENYVASYASFFGRYMGEFVHAAPTRLLFCLGEVERKRKRKIRARFRWNFISIFQAVSARKMIFERLESYLQEGMARRATIAPRMGDQIERWLGLTAKWHGRLLPPHRKFFYELARVLRLGELRARLEHCLGDITRTQSDEDRRQVEDYLLASISNIHWLLRKKEWVFDPEEGYDHQINLRRSQLENAASDLHEVIVRGLEPLRDRWGPFESRIVALVGNEVFQALTEEARESLVSAEVLLDLMDAYGDFSAPVLEFAKAAELDFNLRILPRLFALVGQGIGGRALKVVRKLIGRLEKRGLTLGELPYLFAPAWSGALSGRTYSNASYDPWARNLCLEALGNDGQDADEWLARLATELQTLAEYRNKAAHTRSIDKRRALAVRRWWGTAATVHALMIGICPPFGGN